MLKKCKVVMLLTNEKAEINLTKRSVPYGEFLTFGKPVENKPEFYQNQHLYIVSDEKIKEGDYFLSDDRNHISEQPKYRVERCIKIENGWIYGSFNQMKEGHNPDWSKKIIATTDDLFVRWDENAPDYDPRSKTGGRISLPKPSQSFIEKYIEKYNKDECIEEVMVEYENCEYIDGKRGRCRECQENGCKYPTKLKLNTKDNTITIKSVKTNWNSGIYPLF